MEKDDKNHQAKQQRPIISQHLQIDGVEEMDTHDSLLEINSSENMIVSQVVAANEAEPIEVTTNSSDVDVVTVSIPPILETEVNNTVSTIASMEIQNLEMDKIRSEATFTYKVENISKLRDSELSAAHYIRNLPWKLMVMPRMTQERSSTEVKSLGVFLQCNGESDTNIWSCNAVAELRLLSHIPGGKPHSRKIKHLFYNKENDWGFSCFLQMSEVFDPLLGYVKDDAIVLEVFVDAEAPHGVLWDSKKLTGYVGLKNQGATCYMNSLLQTLFFTNHLRKCVYKMPTEFDDSTKSVALALQRVFHDLQFADKPVGTKKLTKSFGWETLDSFMQHDVQEFLRVLLDKIECKMKGTCVEGTIPRLFEGKMISYIKCKNVDYNSTRIETFYDIQLNINGKRNIYESFNDYVATEILRGDNKYDAGEHGLQEAEKGVIFQSFPPILHLHLMRFQYDPVNDISVKFNDRLEFSEKLNLDEFLQKPESTPANYTLQAVLVHSGDNHGGHYVVFINPKCDGKWCKFDDDVVSSCKTKHAIDQNFGGIDDDLSFAAKNSSNAYMLVYIRDSAMKEILEDVTEKDITFELAERLSEEKRMELIKRRERNESTQIMTVNVLLEDYFELNQTTDLIDPEKVVYRSFKIKKSASMAELIDLLSSTLNISADKMRIWPLVQRNNSSFGRPTALPYPTVQAATQPQQQQQTVQSQSQLLLQPQQQLREHDMNCSVTEYSESHNPWNIFLEILPPDSELTKLANFDYNNDILVFYKFYDPTKKHLHYCGLDYIQLTLKMNCLLKKLSKLAELMPNSHKGILESVNSDNNSSADANLLKLDLQLYRVNGANVLQKVLVTPNATIESCFEELQSGDIIIFERKCVNLALLAQTSTDEDIYELPTCEDYCKDLLYRIEVTFVDKSATNDPGFTLELSQRTKYDQMAKAVGQRLNCNPFEIQFFRCQQFKEDRPGQPVKCTYDGTLKDILVVHNKQKCLKKLFYQKISMNISELENKKQFKCIWVSPNMKDEKELVLYPHKNGCVKTLLEEAGKIVDFSEDGTKRLRICEVTGHKVKAGPSLDLSLDSLDQTNETSSPQKIYRIEEIPREELNLRENELLIGVTHFHKDIFNTFGTPFFIKAVHDEPYGLLKERIKNRINVPDKEWEKYKFAVITTARTEYIHDDTMKVNLADFKMVVPQSGLKPYIGLEHFNKLQKRSRFSYLEKAIKIYN